MKNRLRVAIVGLGGIAQKVYLPILSHETNWQLVGAFSPNEEKRELICKSYRMNSFSSLAQLASSCDAAFVHSSTASHYEVVSYLLTHGVDVYVDKPLAETMEDAERLAEMSEKHNRKLMVGFNRRFAPMYQKAKKLAGDFDWLHMEKHRSTGVGPQSFSFTMLDEYLHVVDTIRWLAADKLLIASSFTKINTEDQLIFTKHTFESGQRLFSAAMHKHTGADLEKVEFVTKGQLIQVENMNELTVKRNDNSTISTPGSWDTILKTKGFEDCVHHFITSVHNNDKPSVDGWEALKSQQLLEKLITNAKRKKG